LTSRANHDTDAPGCMHRRQCGLRRLVVQAAAITLVTNHQSALEILQIVRHYAFIYVGT
jgi:hypothetical protein